MSAKWLSVCSIPGTHWSLHITGAQEVPSQWVADITSRVTLIVDSQGEVRVIKLRLVKMLQRHVLCWLLNCRYEAYKIVIQW